MSKPPHKLCPNESEEATHLIWLDETPYSTEITSKLCQLTCATSFCTDPSHCLTLVKSIKDESIVLVVSMALAETILPQIHDNHLLTFVFIFCPNVIQSDADKLSHDYRKVVGACSESDRLLELVQQAIHATAHHVLRFEFFYQAKKYQFDLSKTSASFLWHYLVLDILKEIPDDAQVKNDMLATFDEPFRRQIIQFSKVCSTRTAAELFDENHPVLKTINRALRTKNIQLIYLLRDFFIHLYDQFQPEKKNGPENQKLTFYYRQILPKFAVDQLRKQTHGYILPSHFISASSKSEEAILSTRADVLSDECQPTLVQFDISSAAKRTSFIEADTSQEVIFNANTVFKVGSVWFDHSLRLWRVILSSDELCHKAIEDYLRSVRTFRNENSLLIFFGNLFAELGRSQDSKTYFRMLLRLLPSTHESMASVYNQMGNFLAEEGMLKEALEYYQKAYEIRLRDLGAWHPHVAVSLNNISLIYKDEGHLDKALDYCTRALEIDEKNYSKDHVLKAMTMENIGGIYKEKHLFSQAQVYFLRAFTMYKCTLPPNHRFLTDILNSLGKVYCDQGYYDRALTCYEKALTICEANYSNDNLQKAQTIENMGLLYKTSGLLEKALAELLKALAMYENIYDKEHPDVARCLGHIGLVYEANRDFDLALTYFHKQLSMDEKCLTVDHKHILIDIQWIADVHKKKNELDRAFQFCYSQYETKRKTLAENHPTMLGILMTMIDVCDDPTTKSSHLQKALSIYESSMPPDMHATISCLDAMVNFYSKNNQVHEALSYQVKMVDLERKASPVNNIHLSLSLQRLGQLYETLSMKDDAEQCFVKSRSLLDEHLHSLNQADQSDAEYPSSSSLPNKKQQNLVKSSICSLQ